MAGNAKKTEHAGSKRGHGAYWGCKTDAKRESNKVRRENAKRAVRQGLGDGSEPLNMYFSLSRSALLQLDG